MKRLAFFFDGTWSNSDAEQPSHVVKLCSATALGGRDHEKQIVFYHRGLGSGYGSTRMGRLLDRYLGGAFGAGMRSVIEEAYRHLVLNYAEGDEVYLFGWSRGAYMARRFIDVIRAAGLVPPNRLDLIGDALDCGLPLRGTLPPGTEAAQRQRVSLSPDIATSHEEIAWRAAHGLPEPHLFQLEYVGLWDCVSAMGLRGALGRGFDFHTLSLSGLARSARHAVAIDERRSSFRPSLIDNIGSLEMQSRRDAYKQLWFPGDHGVVGGGRHRGRLAFAAFDWIAEGASSRGLEIDRRHDATSFDLEQRLTAAKIGRARSRRDEYRAGYGPLRRDEIAPIAFELMAADDTYRPKILQDVVADSA